MLMAILAAEAAIAIRIGCRMPQLRPPPPAPQVREISGRLAENKVAGMKAKKSAEQERQNRNKQLKSAPISEQQHFGNRMSSQAKMEQHH